MANLIEQLDPDAWIARGSTLSQYPMLEPYSSNLSLVKIALGDEPALANHVCQWMARVAQTRTAQAMNQLEPVTEGDLRSAWEETKAV
jgi:endo-1,4-beta-mannosidase